jgi:hypothetical protein
MVAAIALAAAAAPASAAFPGANGQLVVTPTSGSGGRLEIVTTSGACVWCRSSGPGTVITDLGFIGDTLVWTHSGAPRHATLG